MVVFRSHQDICKSKNIILHLYLICINNISTKNVKQSLHQKSNLKDSESIKCFTFSHLTSDTKERLNTFSLATQEWTFAECDVESALKQGGQ
jgi:hypothetical protein